MHRYRECDVMESRVNDARKKKTAAHIHFYGLRRITSTVIIIDQHSIFFAREEIRKAETIAANALV